MTTKTDLPPHPIWKYSQGQLAFLVGRLSRIARKPYGQDHRCQCAHQSLDHFPNGRCSQPGCECVQLVADIDHGCDCGVCIAKDAFEQVKEIL